MQLQAPKPRRIALFLVAALSAAASAPADDDAWGPPGPGAREEAEPSAPSPSPDGRRTLKRLPINLLRSLVGLVSSDNALPVLVGGALTAGSFALDDSVREHFEDHDLGGLQSFGDKLGDAEVVVPVTAGVLVIGRLAGNQRFRDMSYDLAQAQLAVGALGGLLKTAVGRQRPNGSNDRSFPSGHSYSWFTNATVVERHYGFWPALPVYGLWAVAGLSRVENETHYLSDMVGGAALGYLIACTTRRVNDAPLAETGPERQARLLVAPWVPAGDTGVGLLVRLEF
jgi:membrane-associated phospholipid phosphatase